MDANLPQTAETWENVQNQVRMHNTAKLRELLNALEPQVLGYTGVPAPAPIVAQYRGALKDLGQLYHVYDPPKPVEDAQDVEIGFRAAQQAVLTQLADVESKIAKGRGVSS